MKQGHAVVQMTSEPLGQMTEFVNERRFVVAKAEGIRFWDVHEKEYLDGRPGGDLRWK